MILQNDYWFDIVPSRGGYGVTIAGKWLHFGPTPELHSWLERLERLVEDGRIAAAKVARKLPGLDPFPDKPCVVCVFTAGDELSKQHSRQAFETEFKVKVSIWKSEDQTRQDWQPGGWLQLEAELNQLRKRIEREGLREEGKSRLRQLADRLRREVETIDPSRKAEIESGRTAALAVQLLEDLPLSGVSEPTILARLDAIQAQLAQLTEKGQAPNPEAALASVIEDRESIFVVMPFAEKHVDTYDAIQRGVKAAKESLRAHRVDEIPGAVQITDEVRKGILKARLIICDLTEARPNVYYELGLAHGLAKQVICIAREGTVIHFDVYGLKILFFETYRSLEEELAKQVRGMLEGRPGEA